jgi:hypothetical protein
VISLGGVANRSVVPYPRHAFILPNKSVNIYLSAAISVPLIHHLSAGKGWDQPERKEEEKEEIPVNTGIPGAAGEVFEPSLTDPELLSACSSPY